MGVTGLCLCSFLVVHLAGNCLLYFGPAAFNTYAHALISSPLLYPAEAVLLSIFLIHILLAILLTVGKSPRPWRAGILSQASDRSRCQFCPPRRCLRAE